MKRSRFIALFLKWLNNIHPVNNPTGDIVFEQDAFCAKLITTIIRTSLSRHNKCSYHSNHIDGLVWERCNPTVNALQWRLSCTNPSTYLSIKAIGMYLQQWSWAWASVLSHSNHSIICEPKYLKMLLNWSQAILPTHRSWTRGVSYLTVFTDLRNTKILSHFLPFLNNEMA